MHMTKIVIYFVGAAGRLHYEAGIILEDMDGVVDIGFRFSERFTVVFRLDGGQFIPFGLHHTGDFQERIGSVLGAQSAPFPGTVKGAASCVYSFLHISAVTGGSFSDDLSIGRVYDRHSFT